MEILILLVLGLSVCIIVGVCMYCPSAVWALVIVSLVPVAVGCFFLSQATMGVGLIAAGCYMAIVARIVQAGHYNKHTDTGT